MLDPLKATVVFSGGQDSTTCLGWALMRFHEVQCVTFDYGQRHAIEIEAAEKVIEFYQAATGRTINHEIITLGDGVFHGTSPLTNSFAELETYTDADQMAEVIGDRIEKTFVPMRNAVFLMMAANRAVVAGHGTLVTGVCQEDNANYPDCRATFIDAATATINEALGEHDFVIFTPLMHLSKAETVKLAYETPFAYAALQFSHTAYDGKYPPTGKDHASLLRAQGFEQAGYPDPLVLRAHGEGLMELPETSNYDEARADYASFDGGPAL